MVKLPDGYASNIGHSVNESSNTFYSMKTHDFHFFMQKLLPTVLRGICCTDIWDVPDDIWEVIAEFCKFFRFICCTDIRLDDVEKLDKVIVVTV